MSNRGDRLTLHDVNKALQLHHVYTELAVLHVCSAMIIPGKCTAACEHSMPCMAHMGRRKIQQGVAQLRRDSACNQLPSFGM